MGLKEILKLEINELIEKVLEYGNIRTDDKAIFLNEWQQLKTEIKGHIESEAQKGEVLDKGLTILRTIQKLWFDVSFSQEHENAYNNGYIPKITNRKTKEGKAVFRQMDYEIINGVNMQSEYFHPFLSDLKMIFFVQETQKAIDEIELINTVEHRPQNGKPLKWVGLKVDLSELIKALSLTGLNGTHETVILAAFESIMTDKNGNSLNLITRHKQNVYDLHGILKANKNLFTKNLYNTIKDFRDEKLT